MSGLRYASDAGLPTNSRLTESHRSAFGYDRNRPKSALARKGRGVGSGSGGSGAGDGEGRADDEGAGGADRKHDWGEDGTPNSHDDLHAQTEASSLRPGPGGHARHG